MTSAEPCGAENKILPRCRRYERTVNDHYSAGDTRCSWGAPSEGYPSSASAATWGPFDAFSLIIS